MLTNAGDKFAQKYRFSDEVGRFIVRAPRLSAGEWAVWGKVRYAIGDGYRCSRHRCSGDGGSVIGLTGHFAGQGEPEPVGLVTAGQAEKNKGRLKPPFIGTVFASVQTSAFAPPGCAGSASLLLPAFLARQGAYIP